jgi:hypothetical protein
VVALVSLLSTSYNITMLIEARGIMCSMLYHITGSAALQTQGSVSRTTSINADAKRIKVYATYKHMC